MAATVARPISAGELLAMPRSGERRELVRGELRTMPPAGEGHGRLTSRLTAHVAAWVIDHQAGEWYAAETGFVVARDPDTVLAPDGALILADRLPAAGVGFGEVVPDLVVEVVAGAEGSPQMLAKVALWLEAGARVVWVAWAVSQTVQVWRGPDQIEILGPADTLTVPDLLPGFALPLARVFD